MGKNSGLQIVELEVTNRCNLNCKHCYLDRKKLVDLQKEKVFELIDEVAKLEVHRLVFTGGEPLLVQEIFEYAKYSKKKNIPQVVLMTNGIFIEKKNLEHIKNFDLVQLSIDVPPGIKPHFRKDYLEDLEKKIDLLKENGIKVHLQTTIHKSLLPHLEGLFDFAKEKNVTLGLNRLILVGNAKDLEKEKLSPLELKECLTKIVKFQKNNKLIRCSDPLLFLVDEKRMEKFTKSKQKSIMGGCIAGISTLYVKSNGEILICPFVNYPIANIFKKSFTEIWEKNKILGKLRDRSNIEGKCSKCEYLAYCGGCRGASLREEGTLFGSDSNCWLK